MHSVRQVTRYHARTVTSSNPGPVSAFYPSRCLSSAMGNRQSGVSPTVVTRPKRGFFQKLFAKTRLDATALAQTCPPPVSHSVIVVLFSSLSPFPPRW
ncbi:unnamed protein product [Haemonchus placei]|uniref:Ash family protein n=1 Tax=Haemonchus placei TaxID=6290 RepID=A0A0N4X368_HAEPC|nr:unnamed protein product [Haemonchus placei]